MKTGNDSNVMRPMARRLQRLLLVLLLLAGGQAYGLSAYVDRTELAANETLRLEIRSNQRGDLDRIDLSGLEQDFEILNRSSQSNYSIVNGKTETLNALVLNLSPLRDGQLVIPAFTHQGKSSRPVNISVTQPKPAPAALANRSVILEAEVDKDSVMLGEQVLYTVRLLYSVAVSNQRIDSLEARNVDIIELEDRQFNRRVNGTNYAVIEKRFALFINQAGNITIPSLTYTANLPSNTRSRFGWGSDPFARGERIRLATEALQITVQQAPPPANTNGYWLPAEALQLSEDWSDNIIEARVGEPLTRSINLLAKGLPAEALPEIAVANVNGVNSYPEKPELLNQEWAGGIAGNRIQSQAIIPLKEGSITLPAVSLDWWNTGSRQMETVSLPARTITVLPAAVTTDNNRLPPPVAGTQGINTVPASISLQPDNPQVNQLSKTNTLLAWASATGWLVAAFLGFMLFRVMQGKEQGQNDGISSTASAKQQSVKQALARLKTACKQNNARKAKAELQHWLQLYRKELHSKHGPHQPAGKDVMAYLVEHCNGESLQLAIGELDSALYGAHGSDPSLTGKAWTGHTLLQALDQLQQPKAGAGSAALPPLYPV